jgi:hypothetical protein
MQPLDVTFFKPLSTYVASAVAAKLREKPGQRLSAEHTASLVGMAFPRAARMEKAKNGFRNSGLWPANSCVFTDDDIAPSMVTNRPETIQLEKTTADGIEHFSLSSAYAAKPETLKQTPGYKGYISVEKISPLA